MRENLGHANIDVTQNVYATSAGRIAKFRCEERKGVWPLRDKDRKLAKAAAIVTAKRLVEQRPGQQGRLKALRSQSTIASHRTPRQS